MKAKLSLGLLATVYAAVLAAGLLAPYDPLAQDRDHPREPPVRLRFVDAEGHFHLRPFVYAREPSGPPGTYRENATPFPVRFFDDGRLLAVEEPARLHLLGTDSYGRDLLSRLLHGGRFSLFTGLAAALVTVVLGVAFGLVAGYYGGLWDEALMRGAELFLALPWLYLLLAVRAALPLEMPPLQAFLILAILLGLVGWARPARLVRGVVRGLRGQDFVTAARGLGISERRLLARHLLPQVLPLALTQLTLLIPRYVLAEVTLSFLGLGVAEPAPSWGNLLAELRHIPVLVSCWWMFLPALALFAVVLSYHQLADAIERRLGLDAV